MTMLTITTKGQVTLKKEVLKHLGVKPGDKIDVNLLSNGRLELAAADIPEINGSLTSFFNSLPNDQDMHASLDDLDAAIRAGWAGEDEA